ncbi:MAG TPA: HK97 family phage prohead protease [Elusimicrobiales bacterium]|nr:HK97 family phage prohead protease [Elusimicrobiales bacterium]
MKTKTKIIGSLKNPHRKYIPISSLKISNTDNGEILIEGYANTKGKADRYGDIPVVYSQKRSYVYDFTQFLKNPVLLIDHTNKIDHIAGSILSIGEDKTGLFFKARFSSSDYPLISHARHIYSEGHAKAISIAGRFHYENTDNPEYLTLAEIYEISLVAVGADPDALVAINTDKSSELESIKHTIENLVSVVCGHNAKLAKLN